MTRHTTVKGRDLSRGQVIQRLYGMPPFPELVIARVVRAGDELPRLREQVAKAKTLPQTRAAMDELERCVLALEGEGREARLVTFASGGTRAIGSQEEWRYVRRARREELG